MRIDYRKINQGKKFCNVVITEETAEELNVSLELVKEIIQANQEFSRKTIERGAYENVTLPYLGKLKARHKAIQAAANR